MRYGSGDEVGPGYRAGGEIRWLLCWLDAPFWPDAASAGAKLASAAVERMRTWRVSDVTVDGSLPAPGVYGVPEQWPHVHTLLREAGFTGGERTETVLLAQVERLQRQPEPDDLHLVRTLGVNGTRFTATRGDDEVGVIEVDTGVVDPIRMASQPGWADIGNLWINDTTRRHEIGPWLLGQAADWLQLGGITRLLAYAQPDDAELLALLQSAGFSQLTTTTRGWRLDT